MTSDLSSLVFATQARVLKRATTTELLTLAQERAVDPSVFDSFPPFVWGNEISSNRLDSYFTKMDPLTTLPNFARAAAAGVAFLIGHDHCAMPFGSTLTGTVETAGDVTRVLADAYCLQEPETQSFVSRVRAGIVKDDSVGFHGGQWICSICGRDMLTDWWECWHVPGLMYEIKDGEGALTTVREVLCWALVKNADLSEVSSVYDGATPGAAILARQAAEAGRLSSTQSRLLEQRYRIHLPDKRASGIGHQVPGVEDPTPETRNPKPETQKETPMPLENTERQADAAPGITPDPLDAVRALLVAAGVPEDQRAEPISGVRWLTTELTRLRPLADDGTAYRTDLVASALAEGARALGASFSEETYRAILVAAPLDTVKRMAADWKTIGDARFPGGRQTDGGETPPPSAPAAPATPDAAYRG